MRKAIAYNDRDQDVLLEETPAHSFTPTPIYSLLMFPAWRTKEATSTPLTSRHEQPIFVGRLQQNAFIISESIFPFHHCNACFAVPTRLCFSESRYLHRHRFTNIGNIAHPSHSSRLMNITSAPHATRTTLQLSSLSDKPLR